MARVSIDLPDDLYQEARRRGLALSALAQQAVEQAVPTARTDEWVARARSRPPRFTRKLDTAALLEDARGEFRS
jgi:post-segregation antitoxin (ccd killing protein)